MAVHHPLKLSIFGIGKGKDKGKVAPVLNEFTTMP
jgi:hypothetical protein